MSKFRNLRNRPFLVVNLIQRVAKDAGGRNVVDTARKGWGENPNHWALFENTRFVDRVSDKNLREATVVIDLMRGECITHRFQNVSDDEVVQHYMEKYRDESRQAISVWLTKVATQMAQDPNFAKAQETVTEAVEAFEVVVDEAVTTSEG